jgi:hypothetical protein
MGAPEHVEEFERLQAGDLVVYLARHIVEKLRPGQSKLLVALAGYGRFWMYLR